MIFGAQARSNKATILLAGTVIFLFIFVGLVYNHLDYWHSSSSYVDAYPPSRPSHTRARSPRLYARRKS